MGSHDILAADQPTPDAIRSAVGAPRVAEVLEQGHVQLAVQPIVSSAAHEVVGYEALVRCSESTFSDPGALFFAAQQQGQRESLEHALFVLAADWVMRLPPRTRLFINLELSCAIGAALLNKLLAPLRNDAARIVIEVSAQQLADGWWEPLQLKSLLREQGFALSVDRVQHAHLGLLGKLSPDYFKTETLMAREVGTDRMTRRLVSIVLEQAKRMGSQYIALGVETAAEAAALHQLGVPLLQGYHFGVPRLALPPDIGQRHWGLG